MTGRFVLTQLSILVTGGTRGIGHALVEQLLLHDPAKIVVVSRGPALLDAVAAKDARIVPYACDLADPDAVDALAGWVTEQHPSLSVLINNAGSQRLTELLNAGAPGLVAPLRQEIALNFEGVIALTLGLMPVLLAQKRAMIVNVTSGLALAPKKSSPVYCATKAAMRSFTKALRYQAHARAPQLAIVEALPPLVDTAMTQGRGRGKISAATCATEIVNGMVKGKESIYVGKSKLLRAILALSPTLADRIMRDG